MLGNNVTNPNSNEYKLTAIVLDIATHRFFKPVGIQKDEIDKCSFMKLSFVNKGLEGINLGNILHNKSIKCLIQPYVKVQSVPIISYAYTIPIGTKIFNNIDWLYYLNIDDVKSKPPDCTCASSPFIYNPAGHVITFDFKIIKILGPKYREPKSINWKHNFKILMDSVEDYARQLTKT